MSTMKNHLCSFLSRLALCGAAAPLILLSPALMRADSIRTFDVSGTASNVSGMKLGSCRDARAATCDFTGTFQVDTTTGTVESGAFNIIFPGLADFNHVSLSHPVMGRVTLWEIMADNSTDTLDLRFLTAPTVGSLVGFTGGKIGGVSFVNGPTGFALYNFLGGSITPVPEPSSLILFASGMLVLGLALRFGKKVGHPLSA